MITSGFSLGFNGKALLNNSKEMLWQKNIYPEPVDPYNPLNLPADTIRVRTNDGNPPIKGDYTSYATATLVPGTNDVYDVYKRGASFPSWSNLLYGSSNVVEVLGANTSNVTDMGSMFGHCTNLTAVPLFDTSNVTNMTYMFGWCGNLTAIPLFNTSRVTTMYMMFYMCVNVQSGALAMYQQASTQTNPPSNHTDTFHKCGFNTPTGAAELAQIPSSWGGTGA